MRFRAVRGIVAREGVDERGLDALGGEHLELETNTHDPACTISRGALRRCRFAIRLGTRSFSIHARDRHVMEARRPS